MKRKEVKSAPVVDRYEELVDAATAEAWALLWAAPADGVYLYFVPSTPARSAPEGHYHRQIDAQPGRMLALADGAPLPVGAELATNERLSGALTRSQLRRRIWELGRRLPIM